MGWEYEVQASGHYHLAAGEYETRYTGNNLFAAIRAMRHARRDGFVLIRFVWRP